jgi:outer membrane protein assembly factor BamB
MRKTLTTGILLLACCLPAAAMDIAWVHMTGRWPVESAPLVTDLDGDGANEILAVNQGGELLLWRADGSSIGTGPDGLAANLPEPKGKDDRWTSSPVRIDTPQGPLVLVAGGGNLVIALGPDLKERWRYTLPGELTWARAVPAILANNGNPLVGYMDKSGAFTVLKADGTLAWSKKSDVPGGATPAAYRASDGAECFIAPLGTQLVCLSANGDQRWATTLHARPSGRPIVARSKPTVFGDGQLACLADTGVIAAFEPDGTQRWQLRIPVEFDNSLVVSQQADGSPVLLVTGVYGNLYAISAEGKLLRTSLFRSKNRGVPLLLDANGDGAPDLVQGTYAQHVLAFGNDGRLVDDLRLNGLVMPTLVPMPDGGFLAVTNALLAYRIRPSAPHSPYVPADAPGKITAAWQWPSPDVDQALRVQNPTGAFVLARVTVDNNDGTQTLVDRFTTQSLFDVELPADILKKADRMHGEVCDAQGKQLALAADRSAASSYAFPKGALPAAWATDPFGAFSESQRGPAYPDQFAAMTVDNLYVGEADQAAFIVAANDKTPLDLRVELEQPLQDKTPFAGTIRLYRATPVGSFNGYSEKRTTNSDVVADALVPLSPANSTTVSAGGAAKLWLAVDARGAAPGTYKGKVTVTALPNLKIAELPLTVNVLSLSMPEHFPLELCTWDYVPNRWFPNDTAQVLDDMQRHGVSIYPRTILPDASADAAGALKMDYAKVDAELDRLKGRGKILFQLTHPAIAFAAPPADAAKHAAELEYIRAFVDHLKQRGLGYPDFAFYPVDEPGLDYQVTGVEALIDAAALFQEADPQIRVYTDPVPSLSGANFDRIAPTIDVWCPNMRQVSGLLAQDPRIRRIMDSGAPVWSYECVGLVKSLSPLRYNRSNPWRAWYFGLDGLGFWTHSTSVKDMWYPSDDEYALVYPGDRPVPSVRWESVRDGMEDIAAVAQLEQAIAKGGAPDAIAHAKDVLRIAKNDAMEMSDATFVESRDFLAAGDRRIWHTAADSELFRRNRAAIAEATLALTH